MHLSTGTHRCTPYVMALQCSHAQNLIMRDDCINLKINNQNVFLEVSYEMFAGNMHKYIMDIGRRGNQT